MSTITIGVDLAETAVLACEGNGIGRVLRRHELRREPSRLTLNNFAGSGKAAPWANDSFTFDR